MKRHLTTIACLFAFCVLTRCKKEDDTIVFEGIDITDSLDNSIGTKGTNDIKDWQIDYHVPSKVLDLLNSFGNDISMSDTDFAHIEVSGYPNPCKHYFNISFKTDWRVLAKVIIVDKNFKMLYHNAVIMDYPGIMGYDFSNTSIFPDQTIVRAYYSFSQKDAKNFLVGHGDIWICRSGACK